MSSSDLFGYNTNDGDGCSLTWDIESGWTWSGGSQTSKDTCLELWGDDKNTTPNDGCSLDCKTDTTETGMKEDGRVIVIMDREHTI